MQRLWLKRRYWLLPILVWSMVVGGSLSWSLLRLEAQSNEIAVSRARFIFKMVESVRLWNARHGGVYARVDAETPPNQWLEVPERELVTPSGRELTMVNPAYMTRQLSSVVKELSGVLVHLTSLKPINPNNRADAWETRALRSFEEGAVERTELVGSGEQSVFRFMAPLRVEKACLKCHEKQGYREGDIRGGVSVSFAAGPLLAPQREQQRNMLAVHGAVWLLLSGLTLFGLRQVRRQVLALADANARQDELVQRRTAELTREVGERQTAEERLQRLLDSSGEGVYGIDMDGRCTFCNPTALKLLGYDSSDALLGRPVHGLFHHTKPDGSERGVDDCKILETLRSGALVHVEDDVFWRKDGVAIPVEYRSHPIEGAGRRMGAVITFSDVSERKRREAQLRQLSRAVEFSPDPVVITDAEAHIEYVNLRFLESTGYTAEEVIGRTPGILKSGETPESTYSEMWASIGAGRVWTGIFRNRRKNGGLYWEEASIAPITDENGVITHYVGLKKDITERKQLEEQIWREANYDALTGLPNRRLFHDRLERALSAARRQRQKLVLLFIDLDRFKEVNDSLGHEAGDQLLQEVAGRLATSVRDSDTVARMGGDEFTVILPGISGPTAATGLIGKLMARVTEPALLKGKEVRISASIGAALFPDDGEAVSELMKSADVAMYQAKAAGRNAVRFHSAAD